MIPVLAGLLLGSALFSGCASTGAESSLAAGSAAEASAASNQSAQPRSYRSLFRFNALSRGHYASPSRHGGHFGGRSRDQRASDERDGQ